MRNVINELNRVFGAQHNAIVTNFIAEQYLLASDAEGVQFTLHDIDEHRITKSLTNLITDFGLTVDELVNGVLVIPAMNKSQTEFVPVIEFRPGFFQTLFSECFESKAGLIREGDSFEYNGKDRHLVVKKHKTKATGNIVGAYINGTVNNASVCIFMDKEEMAGVRAAYMDSKYNGAYPLDETVWAEVLMSSVYRRMLTEPMTELIMMQCADGGEKIRAALTYGKDSFDKVEANNVVLSSWGSPIAKKVILFKASDEKKLESMQALNAEKARGRHLSVVTDNAGQAKNCSQGETADEFDDLVWGGF